jgi:integrase
VAQKKRRQRGTGSVVLRGRIWWIKYPYKGLQNWESSGSTVERDALDLLKRRLAEIEMGGKPFVRSGVTVASLVALVVADYELRKLKDLQITRYRADAHVLRLAGDIKAERFGSSHVHAYVTKRREEGASDTTINRELSIIRRGFTLGVQADPQLVAKAPHIPKLTEDNVRQGFLEPDRYQTLLAALPDRLKCLLVVGYHTGLRLGTLRSITWSQVDLAAGTIRIEARQTKQAQAQTVPIYGDMRPWLEMQKADRDANWPECPWVFHHRNRQIGKHVKGWDEACDAAGIPRVLRHDLRRTAVRNMERAGIPRTVAMRITGHRTESMYRRYDIVNEADLKRAGDKMEQFFESGSSSVAAPETTAIKESVN